MSDTNLPNGWTEKDMGAWQEACAVCGITRPIAEMYQQELTAGDIAAVAEAMQGPNRINAVAEICHAAMERGKAVADEPTPVVETNEPVVETNEPVVEPS